MSNMDDFNRPEEQPAAETRRAEQVRPDTARPAFRRRMARYVQPDEMPEQTTMTEEPAAEPVPEKDGEPEASVPELLPDQPAAAQETRIVPPVSVEQPAVEAAAPAEQSPSEAAQEEASDKRQPPFTEPSAVQEAAGAPSAYTQRIPPRPAALRNAVRPVAGRVTRAPVKPQPVPAAQAPEQNAAQPAIQPRTAQPRPQPQNPARPMPARPIAQREEEDTPELEPYEDDLYEDDDQPTHRLWMIPLCLVLLAGILVTGLLMIPKDADGILGRLRSTVLSVLPGASREETKAEINDLSASSTSGTAPLTVTISLTTNDAVRDVRIVDDFGDVLPTTAEHHKAGDGEDLLVWIVSLPMEEAFNGVVHPQLSTGSEWLDTDRTVRLQIAAVEITPTPAPVITPEPDGPTPTPEVTLQPAAILITPEPTLPPEDETLLLTDDGPLLLATAQPTEEPTATPEPTPEPTLEATAAPTATPRPRLAAAAVKAADPKLIAETKIWNNSGKQVKEYNREINLMIDMPDADNYLYREFGVLTFRSSSFRQNAASGTVGDELTGMKVLWKHQMSSVKSADGKTTYAGAGWTGQPDIITWNVQVRELSNIVDAKKGTTRLTEVILAGLDGNIYFLDLADGEETRPVIKVGYPMRGTPSIHPLSYPLMTVGQYARKVSGSTGDIGLRYFNLLTQKQMGMIDGLDGKTDRPYNEIGSFETSSLYDANSDTMVSIGTNGMLYLTNLGSRFVYNSGSMTISPDDVTMVSKAARQKAAYTAVESSFAMYQNYVFYADTQGILRCVDTNTLTTVWAVDTGDTVEAAVALDLDENGDLWLYTANELNLRTKGDAVVRCYNAATGAERWSRSVGVAKNKKNNKQTPGFKASPVIGRNGLDDLVFYTAANVSSTGMQTLSLDGKTTGSVLIAMEKQTGRIAWTVDLETYTESSPVAVYSDAGKGWIVQCLSDGTVLMLEGRTGKEISRIKLDGPIYASPAVKDTTLVVATTGSRSTSFIYAIDLLDEDSTLVIEVVAD